MVIYFGPGFVGCCLILQSNFNLRKGDAGHFHATCSEVARSIVAQHVFNEFPLTTKFWRGSQDYAIWTMFPITIQWHTDVPGLPSTTHSHSELVCHDSLGVPKWRGQDGGTSVHDLKLLLKRHILVPKGTKNENLSTVFNAYKAKSFG